MMEYLIYKYTSPSGKSYIGQTNDMKRRAYHHRHPSSGCINFFNAIQKYGYDNIQHELLFEGLNLVEANSLEEWSIREHDTLVPNGYNLLPGGLNRIQLPETVQKIKQTRKERGYSEKSAQHLRELSKQRTGKPNLYCLGKPSPKKGIPMLEEQKQKISATKQANPKPSPSKGLKRTEEQNRRNSETHKGKKLSPETIAKRTATQAANRKKKLEGRL